MTATSAFDEFESEVRTYCRRFPAVFAHGRGSTLVDERGREYLDFMCGAGALNYGHNHEAILEAVLRYLAAGGVVHSLDLHTTAKREFIEAFVDVVLRPRGLRYKLQFTGPTGTNAVEAAFKVARRATGRVGVIAFTRGFHGMSLGALAATGNRAKREAARVPLTHVDRFPFDGYLGEGVDTLSYLEAMLDDPGSGIDPPAAFIVETVQGEGGLNVASPRWLRGLQAIARRKGIVLIVDDIQAGCGRTGSFFSFEPAGLEPDVVCLSKSLSGLGMPFSLLLLRPDLDVQGPGDHSGTFRGNNLAFVAARAAVSLWADPDFERAIQARADLLELRLADLARRHPELGGTRRGRGLFRGIAWEDPEIAGAVSRAAFEGGLLAETCGVRGEVLKLMPAVTIACDELEHGMDLLERALMEVLAPRAGTGRALAASKGARK
jgi:diaminobutyrate-2-oxoglutarate transaminase